MSMYPDEVQVTIDGEIVSYPGLENGKFTDGDPSDPAKKPSYIPAATINLILDVISKAIIDAGLEPDNVSIEQLSNALVGTSAAANSKTVRRDAAGRAKVSDPAVAADIATKGYVDSADSTHAALTAPHGAVSAPTANKLMVRDAAGRVQAVDPAVAADIATKGYVDSADSAHAALTAPHGAVSAPTANKLMVRDAAGRAQAVDPAVAADIATKGYTDTALALKLNAATYTPADILSKILGVDGKGSTLDADLVRGVKVSIDSRITTGGARIERPNALEVGEIAILCWMIKWTASGTINFNAPSTVGTYQMLLLYDQDQVIDAVNTSTLAWATTNGVVVQDTNIITVGLSSGYCYTVFGYCKRIS